MSWASERRSAYFFGVVLFFVIIIGGPILYWWLTIPATCFDRKQDQGETAPDKGGPCQILDERYLQPATVLWARSFKVRAGTYTAAAYIQNPNPDAAVEHAHIHVGLYNSTNDVIAERDGETYIMAGGITPVLFTDIDTGNQDVVHTYVQITDNSLVWKRAINPAVNIKINNPKVSNETFQPRIDAVATNVSLDTERNVNFIAVVFDAAGNAFAASGTTIAQLDPQMPAPILFSWPFAFPAPVGRIDIIPLLPPALQSAGSQ